DSLRLADKRPDWFFLIQQDSDFCALPGLISRLDNARIMKPDYPDSEKYMQQADVNINMSGYNTMVRLLYLGRNSIVFPLNHSEQRWNAFLLSRFSKSEVINIKKITPALLESKINKILVTNTLPVSNLKKRWFNGDKFSADLIMKLCQ
ncbi:MAG: glycosyltransferase, partial [Candidatus Firestonebacteria bacterium]